MSRRKAIKHRRSHLTDTCPICRQLVRLNSDLTIQWHRKPAGLFSGKIGSPCEGSSRYPENVAVDREVD